MPAKRLRGITVLFMYLACYPKAQIDFYCKIRIRARPEVQGAVTGRHSASQQLADSVSTCIPMIGDMCLVLPKTYC